MFIRRAVFIGRATFIRRAMWGLRQLLRLACLCALACVDRPSLGMATPTSGGPASSSLEPPAPSALPARPWQEAAADEDWQRVADAIDRLPPNRQQEPGVRYARAVAASQLGDPEGALSWLEGLEARLPELREHIAATRAGAQLEVGPFEAAARYYAEQPSPRDWLASARAWSQAGEWSPALDELARVLKSRRTSRSVILQARELRATIAQRRGLLELARRDWRWLAIEQGREGADVAYEQLSGAPLSKAERLQRAQALAKRGKVSRVRDELARMKRAPGKMPPAAAVQDCIARAHYAARDYARAAPLLERAARTAGNPESQSWFLAAEAWVRARQPERAARLYRTVARRAPRSRGAEKAAYSLARLHYRQGAWQQAEQAYTRYLQRHTARRGRRRARYTEASRYERAISRLAAGQTSVARRDLEQLRRRSTASCSSSLLRHLEAIAALQSSSAQLRARAVGEMQQVVRQAPLSFAALSSTARLESLGHAAPRWPSPPTPARWEANPLELPETAGILAELGLYSAAETALHARQRALASRYAPRGGEALCRQYEGLERGFRRFAWARSVLRDGVLLRPPRPDSMWAWQCLYPRPFSSAVSRLESLYELPSGLLYSVMRVESAFRPDARSPVGALGLMQLMPTTAARVADELGLDGSTQPLGQPLHNLRLGAHYLSKLLRSFDGHVPLALASYNAGPRAVERWLDGSGGLALDVWVARIPYRETRKYVQRVLANWARYRYLEGQPGPELQLRLPVALQVPSELY